MPIDYIRYPPNWKTEIRPRIMHRAGNTCEVDGCEFRHLELVLSTKDGGAVKWIKATDENDKNHPGNKLVRVRVILTIAHLDHDENNIEVSDDRLMAMCQLHHLRYDAAEKSRRKLNKRSR